MASSRDNPTIESKDSTSNKTRYWELEPLPISEELLLVSYSIGYKDTQLHFGIYDILDNKFVYELPTADHPTHDRINLEMRISSDAKYFFIAYYAGKKEKTAYRHKICKIFDAETYTCLNTIVLKPGHPDFGFSFKKAIFHGEYLIGKYHGKMLTLSSMLHCQTQRFSALARFNFLEKDFKIKVICPAEHYKKEAPNILDRRLLTSSLIVELTMHWIKLYDISTNKIYFLNFPFRISYYARFHIKLCHSPDGNQLCLYFNDYDQGKNISTIIHLKLNSSKTGFDLLSIQTPLRHTYSISWAKNNILYGQVHPPGEDSVATIVILEPEKQFSIKKIISESRIQGHVVFSAHGRAIDYGDSTLIHDSKPYIDERVKLVADAIKQGIPQYFPDPLTTIVGEYCGYDPQMFRKIPKPLLENKLDSPIPPTKTM